MPDQCLVLDDDFAPTTAGFTGDATAWDRRDKDLTFQEEPLESALAFHLSLMTGRPLYFLLRSRHIGGRPDVMAVDDEGRLHLFEVKKKGEGGRASARQLLEYLEKVERLAEYVRRPEAGKTAFGGELNDPDVVLHYLLGALVGRRSANRDAESLAGKVQRGGFDPAAERLRLSPAAQSIQKRLAAERARGLTLLPTKPPFVVVGWLVAPHITRPARKALVGCPAPHPELNILELEIARLPARQWVVRRDWPITTIPAAVE